MKNTYNYSNLHSAYLICFYILCGLGFLTFGRAHPVNVAYFIDGLSAIYIVLAAKRITNAQIVMILISGMILLNSFIVALHSQSSLIDYLLVVKVIVYIALISLLNFKNKLPNSRFVVFFKCIVVLYFMKYFLSIIFNLNDRPLLLRENNFELMFFLACYCVFLYTFRRLPTIFHILVLLVIILSGSKSAIITYLCLVMLFVWRNANFTLKLMLIPSFAISAVALILQLNIENLRIDRIVMAQVFWNEVMTFSFLEWLIGYPLITPLSSESCARLHYYPGLFSNSKDGTCYSVILHMFNLRSIIDFGLLGTLAIWSAVYYVFRRLLNTSRLALPVTGVFFLNGFSVSALSSSFFILSVTIFYIHSDLRQVN